MEVGGMNTAVAGGSGPVQPGESSSQRRRQLLRALALAVVGLAVALLVRNAMKPPDARRGSGLALLVVFIMANGLPMLLGLRLPPHAVLIRALAALGLVFDVALVILMALYVLVTAGEGATLLRVKAISSTIGASVICGLALVFRAQPLDEG
jgi:hypothetical protein